MYPTLKINLTKLKENAILINNLLNKNHITSSFLVSKVLAGDKKIINHLIDTGFTHLADSRIDNLKTYTNIKLPKVLLRLPMISEAKKVVKYADISLNSEMVTIFKLNDEAIKQDKIHNIIIMFDLGDLREGIYFKEDYLENIEIILKLSNIKLIGIGTNLTCYGGVIPTKEILERLTTIKENIEIAFNINIEIISGGNSSSIPILENSNLPKGINNLRIGEAIMLGRETAYGTNIKGMHSNVFTLEAEIIELKEKPSFPIGELGMNSFGEIPKITDKGIMKRGIISIGKQDIIFDNLFPYDQNIEIIGGSSDHLICDFTKTNYLVGDIIQFNVNYPGLLQLMTSKYVKKRYFY